MAKINEWLNENIDELYKDPDLKKNFLQRKETGMNVKQSIDVLLKWRNAELRKRLFKDRMLAMAEQILIDHRNKIRRKHVKELLENTKRNLGYQHKLNYINQNIESDLVFFKFEAIDPAKKTKNDVNSLKKVIKKNTMRR